MLLRSIGENNLLEIVTQMAMSTFIIDTYENQAIIAFDFELNPLLFSRSIMKLHSTGSGSEYATLGNKGSR